MSHIVESFIGHSAEIYVRFLAAAEVAVMRGQFNVAKVLRALAASQRSQAIEAARADATHIEFTALLQEYIDRFDILEDEGPSGATIAVRERTIDIARNALQSLHEHPDVPEWIVSQWLHTCLKCGNVVQGTKPERCDVCGVLSTEFEAFGPFYGSSSEHLGQLMPAAILGILAQTPEWVATLIEDVDEQTLEAKPSPQEWSVKELIGHFIETDGNFMERMTALLQGSIYRQDSPPWKLHEGKGYEQRVSDDLIAELRTVRNAVLKAASSLTDREWAQRGSLLGETRSLIDTGTWLANHDRGHLAQIARQVGKPLL